MWPSCCIRLHQAPGCESSAAHLRNVFFIKKFCGCRKVLDLFSHSLRIIFLETCLWSSRWTHHCVAPDGWKKFYDDAKLIVETRSSRCNISAVPSPTRPVDCDYLVKENQSKGILDLLVLSRAPQCLVGNPKTFLVNTRFKIILPPTPGGVSGHARGKNRRLK